MRSDFSLNYAECEKQVYVVHRFFSKYIRSLLYVRNKYVHAVVYPPVSDGVYRRDSAGTIKARSLKKILNPTG